MPASQRNRTIETDTTGKGKENVFTAVYDAAGRFGHYRTRRPRRNVMFVIFTDEAGDDAQGLDLTVARCRNLEIPVYVVGVPAPFGRRHAYIKYVDPDPRFDQAPQWVAIDQGPESLLPERIRLGRPGLAEEMIDSGFGPYGLTRLAVETGGIYFAVHPNRRTGGAVTRAETTARAAHLKWFFDPAVMRPYRPDYVSVEKYAALLRKNRARSALVEAARLSWVTPMESVRRRFPKRSQADLARLLAEAQRVAAKLERPLPKRKPPAL